MGFLFSCQETRGLNSAPVERFATHFVVCWSIELVALSTSVSVPLKGSCMCEGKCEDLPLQVAISLFIEIN